MKNETIENVSRRSFLKTSGTLVLAASLPTMDIRALPRANAFNTSVYLDVAANGDITVTAHRVEMGQGIRTALAQIVADELGVCTVVFKRVIHLLSFYNAIRMLILCYC